MKKDASKANIWPGHSKMSFKEFKVWFERHYDGDVVKEAKKLGIKVPADKADKPSKKEGE